ncbi:uncharacterized protein LOC143568038 [Bidens hawaiensis]|uniref:uncharacterized protein LOC143568038 n=1 Tax=Bidens hawaiensis TaxID=980011 RepID=UPI00404B2151
MVVTVVMFGNRINRSIKGILDQCLDGDWITFKKVPVVKQKSMFKRFKTKYRWDPRTEQNIYDGFINVLKRRFRDNMKVLRKQFKQNARDDGHEFPDDKDNFDIMCKYSPDDSMPLGKWQRMCDQWNTEQWKKRSEAGRANRKNDLCRHTGGSIGIDEHRLRMGKKGDKVRYRSLFIATHATKECKKRLRDGEITEKDLDKLKFVTPRAKRSYVSYMQQLQKLYGNMDCDDLDVWESLHPECQGRPLFGVGSADPLFVVTGTPSSTTCGSYGDAQQSQELQKVQAKLDNVLESRKAIQALLEQHEHEKEEERAEREREHEKERVERELEREKDNAEREEWQKRMEEMFKKLTDK